MNKFTLQTLALTGILAVSGLPAFAANMTPATPPVPSAPAVNGSVSTGTNAQVKSTTDKAKVSAEKKTDKVKKTAKDSKNNAKAIHQQTAQKPAASVPNASVGANSTTGVTTPAPVGGAVH